jgi:hypothetical protein
MGFVPYGQGDHGHHVEAVMMIIMMCVHAGMHATVSLCGSLYVYVQVKPLV